MPMIGALLFVSVAIQGFTPPQPWGLGFAATPRMPFAGDVDGDGYADMIVVYPTGDCIIDVNLTIDGQKSSGGIQALRNWGKNCQAATVGEFDVKPGTDVAGIFDGKTIRLAVGYHDGHFADVPNWAVLPEELSKPALATLTSGKEILAFSTTGNRAYRINTSTKKIVECSVPGGTVWIGDAGQDLVGQDRSGNVFWLDRKSLKRGANLGRGPKDSRPAAAPGLVAFGDQAWTPTGTLKLDAPKMPVANTIRAIGDFDKDGDPDIVEYRYGSELHTGNAILLRRAMSPGETDWDHDGLTNDEEKALGTDPMNPDTDGDGLLDGWEVKGFRGIDFEAMGCSPLHTDLVCLISRYDTLKEDRIKAEIDRVKKFYKDLNTPNLDGTTGFSFHPIYLDPVLAKDQPSNWWENRVKFRPEKWRGVLHWMQIAPGGGGQADELGDGGAVGDSALWAVFVHEFGHQMGLDHEGFWKNGLCPIYTSLMNYAYSYSLEDDRNKIHYSDGRLAGYVLKETDLDETIPLPYEQVKFLEKGPYYFRLKPNGKTTLIDWNWNGIFGEKHIRADINYSYSTNAGLRDDVGKTKTSPWLFVHKGKAFALFGTNDAPVNLKADPTLSVTNPGRLMLRRLRKPFDWDQTWTIELGGLIGDPVAASHDGRIWIVYQTPVGVMLRQVEIIGNELSMTQPTLVNADPTLVPTVGEFHDKSFLFLWNPSTGVVQYRSFATQAFQTLTAKSTNPVSMCTDTIADEAVIGLAQNQDAVRVNRWQIRRYKLINTELKETGMEWVDGENGQARGVGRLIVLFDASRDAGPKGRIYLYGRGMTNATTPWACTYVAQQIADKTVSGGWKVKRYYDEWTQTRSAPAAAWFGGDTIWAYRWVDGGQGATDNTFHVGYKALGIQDEPMGDHDDLTFFRTFGIQYSIINLGRN